MGVIQTIYKSPWNPQVNDEVPQLWYLEWPDVWYQTGTVPTYFESCLNQTSHKRTGAQKKYTASKEQFSGSKDQKN